MLTALSRDIRQSARALRNNTGLSLVVIAVLSLGIGANTALFSIIDRVLLHPFPFRNVDRLVEVTGIAPNGRQTGNARIEIDFLARSVRAFERTATFRWQNMVLTNVENTDYVYAMEVSQHLFDILGVPPELGRTFRADEFQTSAPAVAVIGDRLWRKHFRADPNIIGRPIFLDGRAYTVVGVMGPDFVFTNPVHQVWIPSRPDLVQQEPMKHALSTVVRLGEGATLDQAQRETDAVTPALPPNPDRQPGWHVKLQPFLERFTGSYRRALLILWSAVGLVLLIACANSANLLLARASQRRREFALRASLGASAFELIRQILAETLALGIAAGLLGVALAFGLLRLLVALFPDHLPLPQMDRASLNAPALAVTVAVVLLTVLLTAVPSSVVVWRTNLTEAFGAGRSSTSSRAANRTRQAMIALEAALALMLLAGAGLMLHTLQRLMQVPLGFNPQHVLTARISIPPQFTTLPAQAGHYSRLLGEVRSLPGVEQAAIATVLPFGGLVASTSFTPQGRGDSPAEQRDGSYPVYFREISPGYFSALGMRLLRGRDFNDRESPEARVVIVSDALARHFWPGEDPIGKRVARSDHPKPGDWWTIVGMVESAKHRSLETGADAELYFPYMQQLIGARYTHLVLRTSGDPLSIAASLARRIHDTEPGQPLSEIKTMRTLVEDSAAEVRFNALLLEILGGLALALAWSGIFAMVSYSVSHRTREIGIRGALGASPRDVARFVLAIAMRPVSLGACIGIAGALAATRLLQSQLFETAPTDPLVFSAVCLLLLVTALVAASIPAWRATRIDPAEVLRAE